MTITDGKPSSISNTYEKVLRLTGKHIKLFFRPVFEFANEELALMKKWQARLGERISFTFPGSGH